MTMKAFREMSRAEKGKYIRENWDDVKQLPLDELQAICQQIGVFGQGKRSDLLKYLWRAVAGTVL